MTKRVLEYLEVPLSVVVRFAEREADEPGPFETRWPRVDSSEFLAAYVPCDRRLPRADFSANHVRHLSKHEVAVLEAQGQLLRQMGQACSWHVVLFRRPFPIPHFRTCVLGAWFGAGKVPVDSGLSLPSGHPQ